MQNHDHILLIGPMGAGKSTLGLALAALLGRTLLDVDAQIVMTAGKPIPVIFEEEGEAGFRERETQALRDLINAPAAVIATGGGAVLREKNRRIMRAAGIVVYLQVAPNVQLQRIAGDTNRPLLHTDNPAQRLADLQAQREPLYRSSAQLYFDTSTLDPQAAAATLAAQIASFKAQHA